MKNKKKRRVTHCALKSSLPLLPSGPGGVCKNESRRTRHSTSLASQNAVDLYPVPTAEIIDVLGVSTPPEQLVRQAMPARPRIGFVSLGCPKNLVDSEVMMGMVHHAGAELTPDAADADIIVVNTCSFIDSAKQESVNTILEMAAQKTGGR